MAVDVPPHVSCVEPAETSVTLPGSVSVTVTPLAAAGPLFALQWQRPPTDLALTKTDAPDPVLVGQELTYTLSVTRAPKGVVAPG